MLECKRRGGAKEDETDKRRSYFGRRIEDYQDKLSQNCGDDDYMDPKNSKYVNFRNVFIYCSVVINVDNLFAISEH